MPRRVCPFTREGGLVTKTQQRVRQLLDLGYKWRQAYAIAKAEEFRKKRKVRKRRRS